MTFGQSEFLYALAAVPAAALLILWASPRRRAALARLGDAELVMMLSASVDKKARGLKGWFWLLARGSPGWVASRAPLSCGSFGRIGGSHSRGALLPLES